MSAIDGSLRNAGAGRGSVVLVEGRRGFGKSRLLHEAGVAAAAAGFRVGVGAAVLGDESLSMAPLLAALLDGPAPVLDGGRVADLTRCTDWSPRVHQLESMLDEIAGSEPVLVCIDDAQWADGATIAALRTLPYRLSDRPIVWVIAFRDRHAVPQLMDLVVHLSGRGAATLVLQPLDEETIAQLVADVVRAEPASELLAFAGHAGGSPALVVELMRGLVDEGLVRVEGGRAELPAVRVPQSVCEMVRKELARVSALARHASVVASILGATASFDHLAAMLDVSPASLLGPVEELVRAEVLVHAGSRLGFPNGLIRDAVTETVPPAVRHALQRQAIAVLLDAGESPIEPALSLASSVEAGDRAAISALIAASRALGKSDLGVAAELSRRAFDLTAVGDELRSDLVREMALLLHAAGRADEGKRLADEALRDRLVPEVEAEIRLSVARMPDLAPDVRRETGREALALPGLPLSLRAQHVAEQVGNALSAGRHDLASAMLTAAEATVAASGDPSAALALDAAKAQLAYMDGTFEDALRQLDAMVATGTDDEEHTRLVGLLRAESLIALDEFDAAHRVASDGSAAAVRDRRLSAAKSWQRLRGRCMLQAGRVLDADATLDGLFDAASPDEVVNVSDAATMAALGRLAIHVGDGRRARNLAKLAEVVLVNGAPELRRHAAWLLAHRAMAAGDAVQARAHLAELGEDGDTSTLPMLMVDTTDHAQLVRLARDAGDDELARSTVAAAEARCRRNPGVRSIAGAAAHARGLLDRDTSVLAAAIDLLAGGPRRLAHASALEDYGAELVRQGNRAGAADVLGHALKIYSGAGAAWDASRVRRRLRDLGIRRRIVHAVRPATGWAGLTDAEVAVVRLVAEGLTNRQVAEQLYVSPHTVSMHLRHVFTKLELNSRVELTRLAYQHDQAA